VLNVGQDSRIANLVAMQVQNWEAGSVGDWLEKRVGLPRGRQGARFRVTVADDASDDQVGFVKRRPERMAERYPNSPPP
jgi:hypothetical protein